MPCLLSSKSMLTCLFPDISYQHFNRQHHWQFRWYASEISGCCTSDKRLRCLSATNRLIKVNKSHYRPWQARRVLGGWGYQILRNRHMKVGRLSALRTSRFYNKEIFLLLISFRGWADPRAIVRPEELFQWKIPVTASGIDSTTCRFAEQCLNHWAIAFS
jgi:hypothetical protein